MPTSTPPTVLIVPGLRDAVPQHWQTLLQQEWPGAASVEPMGRTELDCSARVRALEQAVAAIGGPVLLVAHSAGCLMVAHWAARTALAGRVHAALLATPPDFERPMPEGYPKLAQLEAAGWFPIPTARLPFPSLVATSDNDPPWPHSGAAPCCSWAGWATSTPARATVPGRWPPSWCRRCHSSLLPCRWPGRAGQVSGRASWTAQCGRRCSHSWRTHS